jgi:hypothetical protein
MSGVTGETQLRAKRTRIKILRAIAEKKGAAGFSDIKVATGLSTGSIYYHLERMSNYVTKDVKHYVITDEGRRLLRESDAKYTSIPRRHGAEEQVREQNGQALNDSGAGHEEPISQDHFSKVRRHSIVAAILVAGTLGFLHFTSFSMPSLLIENNIMIVILILAGTVGAFFAFRGQTVFPQVIGYRLMLSVLSAAVILSGIIFLSGAPFSGAASPHYDNSMDALLSSYSLHWQVR